MEPLSPVSLSFAKEPASKGGMNIQEANFESCFGNLNIHNGIRAIYFEVDPRICWPKSAVMELSGTERNSIFFLISINFCIEKMRRRHG